jgi:hypothetical protein
MMNKMNSNLHDAYLPAMKWLRRDDADRFRDESRPIPFPKFDSSVAVSGKSKRQLVCGDLAIFGESTHQKTLPDEHSSKRETKSSVNNLDELFLPRRKKGNDRAKVYPHTARRPIQRYLNPAQRLPRTARHINALPACLIAGLQPSGTFQAPKAVTSLDQRPQNLQAPPRPPKENYSAVVSQGGISRADKRAHLVPAKPQTGRRRSSALIFDPVRFAQVPSHYEIRRKADKQELQSQTSLPRELPPLRVVSALRFSVLFPDLAPRSSTPGETPQFSRIGPNPRNGINENPEQGKHNSGPRNIWAKSASSEEQKDQYCCSAEKFDPVQFAQTPSHPNFSTQSPNQELQKNKALSPFIPPLRPVSSFRLSDILSSATENLDSISHSPERGFHPPTRTPKIEASRIDFANSFDGSCDTAPSDLDTLPFQRARVQTRSNKPSCEVIHRSIRRQKGHENLRMVSTMHTLPPLPVMSHHAFPDFSQY